MTADAALLTRELGRDEALGAAPRARATSRRVAPRACVERLA